MYSKEQADTIVTNCDHLLYLGGQDIETARYIGYRSNKTEDHILLMPIGKAYLIERGKLGIMVDRVPPYEIEQQSLETENQENSEVCTKQRMNSFLPRRRIGGRTNKFIFRNNRKGK